VADAQQPFRRPLAHALQILRQRGSLLLGSHQTTVFFAEGSLAFLTPPTLVAVAGGSILHDLIGLAMRAVHAIPYCLPPVKSIPV
jgi:hypothetical protein